MVSNKVAPAKALQLSWAKAHVGQIKLMQLLKVAVQSYFLKIQASQSTEVSIGRHWLKPAFAITSYNFSYNVIFLRK